MTGLKTNSSKRRDVRRVVPRPSQGRSPWLSRQPVKWAALYVGLLALVGAVFAMFGREQLRYQVGQVVTEPIVSRVPFGAIDWDKTLIRQRNARDLEPAVYVPNTTHLQQVRQGLMALGRIGADQKIETIEHIPSEVRQSLNLTPEALASLRQFQAGDSPITWEQLTEQFMQGLAGLAVLEDARVQVERSQTQLASKIVVRHPDGSEMFRHDEDLISVHNELNILRARLELLLYNKVPQPLRRVLVAIVMRNPQPTYLYDRDESERRRMLKFNDQALQVRVDLQPNQVLVAAGKSLTELDIQLIQQERKAYAQQLGTLMTWVVRPAGVGVFLIISLGLWAYIGSYNPRIIDNPIRGLGITVLILACQAMAVVGTGIQPQFVFGTAVFPTLLTAIILAIVYNQRFALAVGAIHSLIVLISLDLSVGFGLVLLVGVGVAVNLLREVRSRSTIVRVGLLAGVAMSIVTLLVGLSERPLNLSLEVSRIGIDALLVLATGFATGLVVQGMLPWIEKLFRVTTSMTLRELNDASHPLLRRLAQEAPGTYQHSLRIADMAEAAAEAIGADGLLCKVGAMYHDIGKINKPMYFVENQAGGPNRHNKLSPAMSLLIIVGHVKDGVEMARAYSVPRVLRHFIESHHGTTLVEYFFHAAKQKRDAENKPAPAEFEFRYPGPKPQTREAAILMLCDGSESAARSLVEPNANRIDQLVHAMANKRLMDGQFDECNLTLKELHKIEQSVIKTLCAAYHGRIQYPSSGQDGAEQGVRLASNLAASS